MQDCYPGKRATNQIKALFHLSNLVGIACIAKSFSKRVAVPATIPFVTPHKPMRTFRTCSCLVSLGQEFQVARGRSGPLLLRSDQVIE